MKAIEAYDSAYPGSMHQREDGSFIRREDPESLAGALLALIKSGDRAAEDLQQALADTKNEADKLRSALQLFILAGFGNSTDFRKQLDAYDAAVETLK